MSQKTHAGITCTIGIDTGKNTLHLVGLDDRGTIVLREKVGRSRIRTRLANIPPCLIGIEAGMATHYVARELIPPCSTTIRATPVLFFLSSAREMAAALCPFFHRSHSSAFCAAVNQIRDVTMAHLLTS